MFSSAGRLNIVTYVFVDFIVASVLPVEVALMWDWCVWPVQEGVDGEQRQLVSCHQTN